jgi:SAM-dependent methyltransferase
MTPVLSIHKTERPQAPRWALIARHILDSQRMYVRGFFGWLETEHGATHEGWTTEQSLAYIKRVFAEYLAYGGLSQDWIAGKRILEIGPGDSLGVALQFLAAGAEQVVCVDRFRPNSDPAQQCRVYQALYETLSTAERPRVAEAVHFSTTVEFNPDKLQAYYGTDLDDSDTGFSAVPFDLVISRAVVTEFANPNRTFHTLDRLLRTGGRFIHKVAPLNDYGIFRKFGYHPLEFLTVPESLYLLMIRGSGKPNRRLLSYYRSIFLRLGYDLQVAVVALLGSSEPLLPGTRQVSSEMPGYGSARALLDAIRPRLQPQFQCAPEEDLIVADAFLAGTKPELGER